MFSGIQEEVGRLASGTGVAPVIWRVMSPETRDCVRFRADAVRSREFRITRFGERAGDQVRGGGKSLFTDAPRLHGPCRAPYGPPPAHGQLRHLDRAIHSFTTCNASLL